LETLASELWLGNSDLGSLAFNPRLGEIGPSQGWGNPKPIWGNTLRRARLHYLQVPEHLIIKSDSMQGTMTRLPVNELGGGAPRLLDAEESSVGPS
jgi:hypothetical protein